MSLLQETRRLIEELGIKPQIGRGQNFCVDLDMMKRMVQYADVREEDTVLEVGAGLGSLTALIAKRAGRVIAVEIDHELAMFLRKRMQSFSNVEVLEGDFLQMNLPRYDKVVSNPPYSISSELLQKLISVPDKLLILTLQKDFVDRIVAQVGSENYGWLSVMVALNSEIEVAENIPSNCFYPQPKISSVTVRIRTKRSEPGIKTPFFESMVKHLFAERNKKAENGIVSFISARANIGRKEVKAILRDMDLEDRPRVINPDRIGSLSSKLDQIFVRSRRALHGDIVLYIHPEVYPPSDDTYMLAEHVNVRPGSSVLDVGTGSGFVALKAARYALKVVGVDVNPYAVEFAQINGRVNSLEHKVEFRLGDLFDPIEPDEAFDLITFNPPYLPTEADEDLGWIGRSWSGGPDGRSVIDRFLCGFSRFLREDGELLMVQSSLSDVDRTIRTLHSEGCVAEFVEERRFDFESLYLVQARRDSSIRGQQFSCRSAA